VLVAAALAGTASVLARRAWPRLAAATQARRRAREGTEGAARARLRQEAPKGDAGATYRALSAWRSQLTSAERAALDWDDALAGAIAGLERALFGSGTWSAKEGRILAEAVGAARLAEEAGEAGKASALPPLNPDRHART